MIRKNKTTHRLTQAMLETARDMRQAGFLDKASYEKITMRHLGVKKRIEAKPVTGKEIRKLRERAHEPGRFCTLSQRNGWVRLTFRTG